VLIDLVALLAETTFGGTMALPQETQVEYVDRADVNETFVDSIYSTTFNTGILRIEFDVTRLSEPKASKPHTAKQYPMCRLVMTPDVAVDLFNRLNQFMGVMKERGLTQQTSAPAIVQASNKQH
jgi:hypothetical protein